MAGIANVGRFGRRRCAVFALVFFLAQALGLIGSPGGWLAFAPGSAEAAEKWTGGMASEFAGGDGTETDPYRIASADQLAYLAKLVNKSDDKYVTKHYKLTADIDLGSDLAHQWTPIGGDSSPFKGTFDGDGHVVTGMRIVSNDYKRLHAGLFGYVNYKNNAVIKNIGVTDFVVSVDKKADNIHAGGLVGFFSGKTLQNAYASGSVSSSSAAAARSYAGGLVGHFSSGILQNASASGPVSSSSSSAADSYAGGLVGYFNSGTLQNASASGPISSSSSSESKAGGLVGEFSSGMLQNASASGAVSSSSSSVNALSYAGGLVGYFAGSTLQNACASGAVSSAAAGESKAGGLVGHSEWTLLSSSYASGAVFSSSSTSFSQAGGLVGYSKGAISSSYATGFVEATAPRDKDVRAGGLAATLEGKSENGLTTSAQLKTSYAWGAVSADANKDPIFGGLVGAIGNGVSADQIISNDWRRDAQTGVNAALNVGIGSDKAKPAVEQTTHARSLDVSQFGVASRDHFVITQGWDFDKVWSYTSLDNGARPHLLAFFGTDMNTISPDLVRLTPNAVIISAGEKKNVTLSAAGWEKSIDKGVMNFTPSPFNGVTISQHGTSPDVIVISAGATLYSDSTEVSVDFKVAGYEQQKKGFVLKVIGDDYASADILAISADIGGTTYNWVQQSDGKTWKADGLPHDADLSAVALNVSVHPGASHTDTTSANLEGDYDITVTAPDGTTTRAYTVVTNRAAPPTDDRRADILSITGVIGGKAYSWQPQSDGTTWVLSNLPYDADLSAVDLNVSVYAGATHTNTKGVNLDDDLRITVTAPDGITTKIHTVVTNRATPPPYHTSADILGISADIGGTAYEWQRQNGGTTWALSGLPYDADLSSVDLRVSVYPGAKCTGTTDLDLYAAAEIIVTAPDGTTTKKHTVVTSRETPPVIPTKIVDDDPSHAAASLDERADGSYGVDILVRFIDDFDHPTDIETAYVDAVSMSITNLRWIDDELNSRDITPRAASQYALHMTGTAPSRGALADASLTKLAAHKYDDAATYTQTLDMKLSDIPGGKPDDPPIPPISPDFPGGSGAGCATGAGALALLALAPALAILKKSQKTKQKD